MAEVSPAVLGDQATQLLGDRDGVVVASGVDNEDLIADGERGDAARKDFSFVPDHHYADHPL